MSTLYIADKSFGKSDLTNNSLPKGEYESCRFSNCDFSHHNFSEIKFINCSFNSCDLSLVNLTNASLQDVKFTASKLLGIHFESCNAFGFAVSIHDCQLNHSSFFKMKMKKTVFRNSSLKEVDFTGCDLSAAVFDNTDLTDAHFENSILEKADFRTAFNYSIDPESNKMKKARFSSRGLEGLLHKYNLDIE